MLLSPNQLHCTHLCLAQAQRWLSCHWQLCSSTSSLEIDVGIPGSQSLPLLLRWAWSPHSSDRSVAAWVRVLGCSHRGWAESLGRNTGDQLPRTWKKNTRKKKCCQAGFHLCTWFTRMGTENQHRQFLCIPHSRKHPFHYHPSPRQPHISLEVPYRPNKARNSTFNIFLPFSSSS